MKLETLFQLADELVFTKTGKHLDDLQQTILQGTLQGKKYIQIATETSYSDSYIKEAASELWHILSEAVGEQIKKSNFRATFERLNIYNDFHLVNDLVHIGDVNFCGETLKPDKNPEQQPPKTVTHINLDKAPQLNHFYGRNNPLTTLKQWIIEDKTRLITLSGLTGMGKTSLSLELIKYISEHFYYIIYRSLEDFTSLSELLSNLIDAIASNHPETKHLKTYLQKRLFFSKMLSEYPCLIILDDGQTLFKSGALAGEYQSHHREYKSFLEIMGRTVHKSCIILNSWLIPREIIKLKIDTYPVQILTLNGLEENATEILREQNLLDEECWLTLINQYQGHPLALKIVANQIKDLFNSKVSHYLKYNIFPTDVKAIFQPQLEQLSEPEKQVLDWFKTESKPVSIAQLLDKNNLSSSELFNIVQSLHRRSLLEKIEDAETSFKIVPIILESL